MLSAEDHRTCNILVLMTIQDPIIVLYVFYTRFLLFNYSSNVNFIMSLLTYAYILHTCYVTNVPYNSISMRCTLYTKV